MHACGLSLWWTVCVGSWQISKREGLHIYILYIFGPQNSKFVKCSSGTHGHILSICFCHISHNTVTGSISYSLYYMYLMGHVSCLALDLAFKKQMKYSYVTSARDITEFAVYLYEPYATNATGLRHLMYLISPLYMHTNSLYINWDPTHLLHWMHKLN